MVEDGNGEVPKLPPDARLDSLDERLDRLQRAEAKRTEDRTPDPTTRIAQLLFGHLIGAPFGGAVVGWGLDNLAAMMGRQTFPWLTLLMVLFGFGVGVRNVMRISKTGSNSGAK